MSLTNDINELKEKMGRDLPAETLKHIEDAIEQLRGLGITDRSCKLGDTAPAFTLPNVNGELVSSADILACGPLVLSFYRGGW